MFPGKKTPFGFTLSLSKFLQAKFNVFIFKFLPFHISRMYLLFLGTLYYNLKKGEKQFIVKTIKHVFEDKMSARELNRLIKNIFRGLIAHYHEKLFIAYSNFFLLKKRLFSWVDFSGENELKEALAKGKGVILVTAHYGAVEWLPGVLCSHGYPTTMILRYKTQKLKESLENRAAIVGNLNLVDLDEGDVFRNAVNALKEGRILITECDEFDAWRPSRKVPLNFLHQQMNGDKTLDIMRKHSGAEVVTALMHRNSLKSYTLRLKTICTGNDDKNVSKEAMDVLNNSLLETPEQWYQWKEFGEKLELDCDSKKNEEGEIPEFISDAEKETISL